MIDGFLFVLYYEAMNILSAKHRVLFPLSIVILLVLAACGPAPETPAAPTDEPLPQPTATPAAADDGQDSEEEAAGYPGPETGEVEESYPAPTEAVEDGPYPPPSPTAVTQIQSYPDEPEPQSTPENGVEFAFERPISAGDTVVSGMGPPGLEVSIVNVTFMGEEIATTTVGSDGRFEVQVPALESGVRIGLTADIEGTDLEERIIPGEGAMGLPQVGYYFDTVVITADS